jgi:hypothetical protein
MAEYFANPSEFRTLNEDTQAKARRVLIASYPVGAYETASVWLVEETYPFSKGYVSKRVFRAVTVAPKPEKHPIRPMTSRNFAELVGPHALMVETKERARRRWTEEIYSALSQVTLRFGPDMVTHWIENESTHEIVSTLRLTHMPYEVTRQGVLVGAGPTVEQLYGPTKGFRDPFSVDFDPDAPWGETLPPAYLPMEHVLGINLRRTGFAYDAPNAVGLDTEVGAYAVEESLEDSLRTASVLEMWLQMTRDSTRFTSFGNAFLKIGMRTLTYGDPYSQSIFRSQHGIQRQDEIVVPKAGTEFTTSGELPFANANWRAIGWSGMDLRKENQRISEGRHPRFSEALSTERRRSLFVPSLSFDFAVFGAFDAIFELFETKDENAFVAALCNLIFNLEVLEAEPEGLEKIKTLAPRLEQVIDKALLGSLHKKSNYMIYSLAYFAKGMKNPVLPPKAIPGWLTRALVGKHLTRAESGWSQELAFNTMYELADVPWLDWNPGSDQPTDDRLVKFEKALLKFLLSVPVHRVFEIHYHEMRRARAVAHIALMEVEGVVTEPQIQSAIGRTIALLRTLSPVQREVWQPEPGGSLALPY